VQGRNLARAFAGTETVSDIPLYSESKVAELGFGMAPLQRVSIFMSIFDCHVNRSPVQGRVAQIVYHPGLFLNADLD
jgi:phosphatidylserine decarboxylase